MSHPLPLSDGDPPSRDLPATTPTRVGRNRMRVFVQGALFTGSVVAFAAWMSLALRLEEEQVGKLNSSSGFCFTYHPTTTVTALLAGGLGCAAALLLSGFLGGRTIPRRRSWARVVEVIAGVVLAVQGCAFVLQYWPDISAQSTGFLSGTYCSGG